MQEGLEDRELGLERGGVGGPEICTVGSIGLTGLGTVGEGAEANAATGRHVRLNSRKQQGVVARCNAQI